MQDIDDLGDSCALIGFVYIRQDRNAKLRTQFGEYHESLVEAETAGARGAGAVRLVERRFVDEADAEFGGDVLQRGRHVEGMPAALQCARPGDQGQWQRVAEFDLAHGDGGVWLGGHSHPCGGP